MGSGTELSYHLLLAKDLGLIEERIHLGLDSDLGIVMRMMSSLLQRIRAHPGRDNEYPLKREAMGQEPIAKS